MTQEVWLQDDLSSPGVVEGTRTHGTGGLMT